MHILSLMEKLREVLAGKGAVELPLFPMPLAAGWCHPDILMAMHSRKKCSSFVFQPLQIDEAVQESPVRAPDLLWILDAGLLDFSSIVVDFLAQLQRALLPDRAEPAFALVADAKIISGAGERGSFWKILFDGVCCGSLSLYSEVFSEPLREPAAILHLELCRMQCFLSQDRFNGVACWCEGHKLQQFVSLFAWQSLSERDLNGEELVALIKKSFKVEDPCASICQLLRVYNSFATVINDNEEICRVFRKTLNEVVVKATPLLDDSQSVVVAAGIKNG